VRELEKTAIFTSSALTLVIDPFFTFVFLAVTLFYSPLLTDRARLFRSPSRSPRRRRHRSGGG
jgi:hypothetical protein